MVQVDYEPSFLRLYVENTYDPVGGGGGEEMVVWGK